MNTAAAAAANANANANANSNEPLQQTLPAVTSSPGRTPVSAEDAKAASRLVCALPPPPARASLTGKIAVRHASTWRLLERNAFVAQLRTAIVHPAAFASWLAHDHLFAIAFARVLAAAAAHPNAPARDLPLLGAGMSALAAELAWFEDRIRNGPHPTLGPPALPKRDFVDAVSATPDCVGEPGTAASPPRPPAIRFLAFLRDLQLRIARNDAKYAEALVALWAIERAYQMPWSRAAATVPRGAGAEGNPYLDVIDRWGTPAFAKYVADLATAVDEAYVAPGITEQDRVDAEAIVVEILRLEGEFWQMVMDAGEEADLRERAGTKVPSSTASAGAGDGAAGSSAAAPEPKRSGGMGQQVEQTSELRAGGRGESEAAASPKMLAQAH